VNGGMGLIRESLDCHSPLRFEMARHEYSQFSILNSQFVAFAKTRSHQIRSGL
jgi:hypothetical protein